MNGYFFTPPEPEISLLSGGEIESTDSLPWLWKPYLAFGAVSILDGDPGVGKSLFTVDLAARLSIGASMPDGSEAPVNPVSKEKYTGTIFINAEDSVRHTILPRLLTAGGLQNRVAFAAGIGEGNGQMRRLYFPQDMNYLRSLMKEVGGTSLRGSFIPLDPMMALFPKISTADQNIRRATDPLVRFAADTQCCVLLVRHLNKTGGGKSMYRGGGSIGILGACRTGLLIGAHPDDPERRVLTMTKSNIGPLAPSLGFRVSVNPKRMGIGFFPAGAQHPATGEVLKEHSYAKRELPDGPIIQWEGPTPITADEICTVKPDLGPQSARAAEWLEALLAKGPVPASAIEAQAQSLGIGYSTMRLVKAKLGIESNRVVVEGQPHWEWALPRATDDNPPLTEQEREEYFNKQAEALMS
jgi:putative DNA primase/helicase